jgi:hypothetical protein
MKRKNYIKSTPEVTAENILNKEFQADGFGKKWLTDVTEMKYGPDKKAAPYDTNRIQAESYEPGSIKMTPTKIDG